MTIEIKITGDSVMEIQRAMTQLINSQPLPEPEHKTVKESIESVPQHKTVKETPFEELPGVTEEVLKPVLPREAPDEPETGLDSEFLPWDGRIHSSNHKKIADGTWRVMKKPKRYPTSESWQNYIDDIKQELFGTGTTPSPETTNDSIIVDGIVIPPPPETPEITSPAEVSIPQTFDELLLFSKSILGSQEFMQLCRSELYNIQNFVEGCKPENVPLIPLIYADLVKIKESKNGNA